MLGGLVVDRTRSTEDGKPPRNHSQQSLVEIGSRSNTVRDLLDGLLNSPTHQ